MRAGYAGALAAWVGFTLPSALAMILFAFGVTRLEGVAQGEWLHGLKVVAVAVVAQAVWGMGKSLCPDRARASLALLAALLVSLWPTALGQGIALIAGGLYGWKFLQNTENGIATPLHEGSSRRAGAVFLTLFGTILLLLPLLSGADAPPWIRIIDSFYRAGSLVFGGGHVVLPLLQADVVGAGWLDNGLFMAGYGAAQAVPGPLFTFAAYLGAVLSIGPAGWSGGLLALVAIFLPSFLLVLGVLPFWNALRGHPDARAILSGINAAVVGLLIAALYHPVWTGGILSTRDFVIALACFGLLQFWKAPSWLVVILAAGASSLLPG